MKTTSVLTVKQHVVNVNGGGFQVVGASGSCWCYIADFKNYLYLFVVLHPWKTC